MNTDYDDFDDLIDFLLDEIDKAIAKMPKERPIFSDKQVMSAEDLEVGRHYIMHKGQYAWRMVLLSMPEWFAEYGCWLIDWRYPFSSVVITSALEDNGVIAYNGGGWNQTNYMEIVD